MPKHRKIPGKKHRGVKDPEAQRAQREEILKPKLNSMPKNSDDQEIPKKLRFLWKQKELAEKLKEQKKTKRQNVDKTLLDSSKHMGYEMRLSGMVRPLKPIPVFKQEPGETQRRFINRMEVTVQQFIKQRNYESKHNVEMVQDPNTGKSKFVDAEKDELETEIDEKKKAKLAKKGIVVKSKEEKRQLKRMKEKERKAKKKRRKTPKNEDDFKRVNESSRPIFNDVVDQPPTLKLPRGVTANAEARRPGAAKGLLLSEKLQGKPVAKKSKPDEMSLAMKERMRIERERVIEQYRLMKKHNFTT